MARNSRILYTPRSTHKQVPRWQHALRTRTIVGGIALVLVATGVVVTFFVPSLQINRITVQGLNTTTVPAITGRVNDYLNSRAAAVFPRRSFFLAHPARIAAVLMESFPKIKSVTIDKAFPSGIDLVIQERALWGILCIQQRAIPAILELMPTRSGEDRASSTSAEVPTERARAETGQRCAYIDETGFAYAPAPASTGSLLRKVITDTGTLTIGHTALPQERIARFNRFADQIAQVTGSTVSTFWISGHRPRDIAFTLAAGPIILVEEKKDPEQALNVLKTVIRKEFNNKLPTLAYIDLRFGNKAFYKLR